MSNSASMQWSEATIKAIEQRLENVPPMLRETIVKKTFKEAAEIFTRKVQGNIRSLHSANRDRWDKKKGLPESFLNNLQTKTEARTRYQASVIVSLQEKVPMLKAYASAVEYGHDMWIPIKQPGGGYKAELQDGRKVPNHPFWRPAKTAVKNPIEALVLRAMNRFIKEMLYGK